MKLLRVIAFASAFVLASSVANAQSAAGGGTSYVFFCNEGPIREVRHRIQSSSL